MRYQSCNDALITTGFAIKKIYHPLSYNGCISTPVEYEYNVLEPSINEGKNVPKQSLTIWSV